MKLLNLLPILSVLCFGFAACNDTESSMLPVFTETVEFENAEISFQENADTVQIPVILSGFAKNDVRITVEVYRQKEMLAREDTNFYLPVKTITIPKGGSAGVIPLVIVNDNEVNINRSFRLRISKIEGAEPARISQMCKINLVNEDFWPEVQLSASFYNITEHETTLVIPVTAVGIFYEPMDVNVKVTNGSAAEGTNFTLSKTSFRFTEAFRDSIVVTLPYQDIQEDISFNLDLEVLAGGLAGKINSAKVTIRDVRKVVRFAKAQTPVLVNAKTILVPVVIEGLRSVRDLTATIAVKNAGGLVEGTDYRLEDNILVTKGDTTLYVKFLLADGVQMPATSLELQIESVVGGEIDPAGQVTALTVTAAQKIDPLLKPWVALSWTSEELKGEGAGNGTAAQMIDGKMASGNHWHSKWQGGFDTAPFILVFDMKENIEIEKICLYRRQTNNTDTKKATIELSMDNVHWGTPHLYDFTTGTLVLNGLEQLLPVAETGRYIRVTVTECKDQNTASFSEMEVWGLSKK